MFNLYFDPMRCFHASMAMKSLTFQVDWRHIRGAFHLDVRLIEQSRA